MFMTLDLGPKRRFVDGIAVEDTKLRAISLE